MLVFAIIATATIAVVCLSSFATAIVFPQEPFNSVYSCLPLDINVEPSSNYSVRVDGQKSVIAALSYTVAADYFGRPCLFFSLAAINTTAGAVNITVGLPAHQLKAVTLMYDVGSVNVLPGFNVSEFNATMWPSASYATGKDNLFPKAMKLQNMTVGKLNIISGCAFSPEFFKSCKSYGHMPRLRSYPLLFD